MGELDGKTVVVTGAASGIGRSTALGFNSDGATVVACDINEDGLSQLDDGIITTRADVSVDADVRAVVDLAMARTGKIDVLINNAGYGFRRNIEDHADGEFEHLVAVHLFGCIYGMRAAIPIMRAQGHGHIINVISRAAEAGAPANAAYGSAKAAMWAASRSAAAELEGTGVRVNMLFPGMTNSSIWGKDMPGMQHPDEVYPHVRYVATLPDDGPTGTVFYKSQPYQMFGDNSALLEADRAEVASRASQAGGAR